MTGDELPGLRAEERRRLARELSGVVAELLAAASVTVMGAGEETDPGRLRRVLTRLGAINDAALVELRLLDRLIRDADDLARTELRTEPGADPAAVPTIPPTAAGAVWTRKLAEVGVSSRLEIPASADQLDRLTGLTVNRVLDVGAGCAVAGRTDETSLWAQVVVLEAAVQVVLRLRPPPDSTALPENHRPLLALRTRIELCGGTVAVHRSEVGAPTWVLTATFPRGWQRHVRPGPSGPSA